MNDRLKQHVNVLFAAAPKNQRAAEMKEELLANLNEKYDDLLEEGYDSTSAFHIALSGIGEIDELFREFRTSEKNSHNIPLAEAVSPHGKTETGENRAKESQISRVEAVDIRGEKKTNSHTPLFIALGLGLLCFGPGLVPYCTFRGSPESGVFLMFLCWSIGIGLLVYVIAKSSRNPSREMRLRERIGSRDFSNDPTAFTRENSSSQKYPTTTQGDVPENGNRDQDGSFPIKTVSILVFAIVLIIFGPELLPLRIPLGKAVSMFFFSPLCIAIGAGLIAYIIAYHSMNPGKTVHPTPSRNSFPPYDREDWSESNSISTIVPPEDITQKRIAAGILAILFGVFGVHKFYLGFTGAGIAMLLITLLSFFVLSPITATIGWIEGLLYLLKTDRDFFIDYELKRKSWF